MIEDTLKKLRHCEKCMKPFNREKSIKSTHNDCHKDFFGMSLNWIRYFMASKERGPCYSYLRYCEDEDVEMCQKCEGRYLT